MNQRNKKLLPTDPKEVNAVYFAINAYSFPIQENFETLYANHFVAEDPKAMPKGLADLFNNDAIKLNNPNLREQISRIMNQYDADSGPWYVDGDDSVLHIHNGSSGPDSGFVFKYQEEYGEVLKVRIGRKEVYGASAVKAMEIPDYNREQTQAVIDPIEKLEDLYQEPILTVSSDKIPNFQTEAGLDWANHYNKIRLTQIASKDPNYQPDPNYPYTKSYTSLEYAKAKYGHKGEWSPNEAFLRSVEATRNEALHWNERYENKSDYIKQDGLKKRVVLDKLDPITVRQLGGFMEEMGKKLPGPESQMLREIWTKYEEEGSAALEPGEKEWLTSKMNTGMIDTPGTTFTTHYAPTTQQYASILNSGLEFRGRVFGGITLPIELGNKPINGMMVASKLNTATGSNYTYTDSDVIRLTTDIKNQQDKWTRQGYNVAGITLKPNTGPDANVRPYILIPDLRKTEEKAAITTLDAMDAMVRASKQPDLHSAFGAAMASVNAARSKLRRAKYKQLEVELLLIGRPALKAGMVITLLGIGKRYSGKWYVKTCIHQIDNTGYTCSLTLQKNEQTAATSQQKGTSGKVGSTSSRKDSTGKIRATSTNPVSINDINLSRADRVLLMRNFNKLGKLQQTVPLTVEEENKKRNEMNEAIAANVGIYENAKSGGHTAVFSDKGVQIDAKQYEENIKKAKEALAKKRQAEKAVADAKAKAKEALKGQLPNIKSK